MDMKVKIVDWDKLHYTITHEEISLLSISLRHRKFSAWRSIISPYNNKATSKVTTKNAKITTKSTDDEINKTINNAKDFEVGGIYNSYYIKDEPIKCRQCSVCKQRFIIDGHRRHVEGILQGYKKFLVEYLPDTAGEILCQSKHSESLKIESKVYTLSQLPNLKVNIISE